MDEKKQLVSIIIPFFNSEKYLSDTLYSAIQQTWSNKEIILIDDGSTDTSMRIAQQFVSSIVKIYQQNNMGASAARNTAFKHSKGDYIQFLDSDDIIATDKIEKQLNRLKDEPAGSIASGQFFNFNRTIENSKPIGKDEGYTSYTQPIEWLIKAAFGKAMFPPVVWLAPRSLIEEAGQWNESLSYNDDPEFFARVLLKSKRIIYCDESVSYYRRGLPSSLGSRKDLKARISELESLNLVTSHMLGYEDSRRVREACSYKYRKLIYSLYPDHKDLISSAQKKINELGIKGDFNFGHGITRKLSNVVGWKNAKLIQRGFRKVRNSF